MSTPNLLHTLPVSISLVDDSGFAWVPFGEGGSSIACVSYSEDVLARDLWSQAHALMEHALWPATDWQFDYDQNNPELNEALMRSPEALPRVSDDRWFVVAVCGQFKAVGFGANVEKRTRAAKLALALSVACSGFSAVKFNGPQSFLRLVVRAKAALALSRPMGQASASSDARGARTQSRHCLAGTWASSSNSRPSVYEVEDVDEAPETLAANESMDQSSPKERRTVMQSGALPKMLKDALRAAVAQEHRAVSVPVGRRVDRASAADAGDIDVRYSSADPLPSRQAERTSAAPPPRIPKAESSMAADGCRRGRSAPVTSSSGSSGAGRLVHAGRSRTPPLAGNAAAGNAVNPRVRSLGPPAVASGGAASSGAPTRRADEPTRPRPTSAKGAVATALPSPPSEPVPSGAMPAFDKCVWGPTMFQVVSALEVDPTLPYADGSDGGPFLALGDIVCAERHILMHAHVCNKKLQRAPLNLPELFEFPHLTLAKLEYGCSLRRANSTIWVPELEANVAEFDVSKAIRCMNEELRRDATMYRLHAAHLEHNWYGHRYDVTGGEARMLFRRMQIRLRELCAPLGQCVGAWAEEPAHPHITSFERPHDEEDEEAVADSDEDREPETVASSSASGPSNSSSFKLVLDKLNERRLGRLRSIFEKEHITASVLALAAELADGGPRAVSVSEVGGPSAR
mmetsp:Transcript_88155/g.284629  ORF Transcript_88155/g.284629 Transcript_88155/m.284629 type:complete len:687 (-) Transcript_88155:343-2403(-)